MGKLSREEVLKLASLSRLKLSEEEINRLQGELSSILNYVKELDKADTTGLEPTYQVTGLTNVTRPDETATYQAAPEAILKIAPERQDGHYKVKKVL